MAQNHEKSNSRGSDFGPKNWPILPLMMSKEDWVKITIAIKKIVTSGENQFTFLTQSHSTPRSFLASKI